MKTIKKIDNYKRIRIPVDFQNHLGWKVDDEIEVEVVGNEIILRRHESRPDFNVDVQDNIEKESEKPLEFSNDGNEEDNYVEQSKEEDKEPILKEDLTKINSIHTKLNKPPTIKEYFKLTSIKDLYEKPKETTEKPIKIETHTIEKPKEIEKPIKTETTEKSEDKVSNQLCPRCRRPIKDSKFMLNNRVICRDCRDAIRDKLILDIFNKRGELQ